MASMNKFLGLGNLGRDPDVRFTGEGTAVTNFSIAVTDRFKDKQGEYQEKTEWINVTTFGKLAEVASKYLTKGSLVFVEGKLKIDKYTDKNGHEKLSPKIVAENISILTNKKQANQIVDDNVGNRGSKPAMTESIYDKESDIPF